MPGFRLRAEKKSGYCLQVHWQINEHTEVTQYKETVFGGAAGEAKLDFLQPDFVDKTNNRCESSES